MASPPDHPDDDALDAVLRDVAVPGGLDGRLSAGDVFSAAAIDQLLAAVTVPPGLAERLRGAVRDGSPAGGVDLDRAADMVGVAQPADRGAMAPRVRRRGAGRWVAVFARDVAAVAASLLFIAGTFFAGMHLSDWLSWQGSNGVVGAWGRGPADAQVGRRGPARPDPVLSAGEVAAEPVRRSAAAVARHAAAAPLPQPQAAPPSAGRVPPPTVLGAVDVIGRPGGIEPGMRVVPPLVASRRKVPRERGVDLAFEIQHGESPFIDPSAAPALATDTPPLAVRTDSFDAAVAAVCAGRGAAVAGVQADDVVAALTPPAVDTTTDDSGPRLSLHAVQSLRKAPPSVLVDIAVTAPSLVPADAAPRDVVIVLDRSTGAAAAAVWRSICRGVEAVAGQLRPADRATVIVAATEPRLLVERGDADAVRRIGETLRDIPAVGGADMDAAFRLALSLDRRGEQPQPRPVVATTVVVSSRDSMERSRDEAAAAFGAWQRRGEEGTGAAGRLPGFVLVGMAAPDDTAGGPRGRGDVGQDSVAIRRGLLEAVFGRPAVTLRECRLAVDMNPAVVASYRVVGHRHSAADSVSDRGVAAVDLLAGETARVVYEVVLKTSAATRPSWLVRATLEGRPVDAPPGTTIVRQARLAPQAIEPATPLPSPRGCEVILAVEVGERLAGSAHAPPLRRDPRGVAALARGWQARGDVTRFGADAMACVERGRSGARSKGPAFDVR